MDTTRTLAENCYLELRHHCRKRIVPSRSTGPLSIDARTEGCTNPAGGKRHRRAHPSRFPSLYEAPGGQPSEDGDGGSPAIAGGALTAGDEAGRRKRVLGERKEASGGQTHLTPRLSSLIPRPAIFDKIKKALKSIFKKKKADKESAEAAPAGETQPAADMPAEEAQPEAAAAEAPAHEVAETPAGEAHAAEAQAETVAPVAAEPAAEKPAEAAVGELARAQSIARKKSH
ncbi:hypothetical protein BO71DRAFT_410484 [Aspergillus ellipticus CBS 707.79]|uniref:Uncharacterized protein n=1 Tax=Aspergillus ellipticus CBS 707.79 TaxID=1448320 RepID=A0A319DP19_9EURO|nr:hypothetical protein BO71DRAFT_410484 [Aspergillus ellipticus CBS 707.79]